MADNSSIPVASGNETFANKDIGGVKYPRHIIADNTGADVAVATAANQTTANNSLASIDSSLQGNLSIDPTSLEDPYSEYETVAASQTDQVLGATGAIGDYLAGIWVQPAAAACGSVVVKDGSTTIYTFPGGGTTALPTLAPIPWLPGITASGAGFSITTGADVSVMAVGRFT